MASIPFFFVNIIPPAPPEVIILVAEKEKYAKSPKLPKSVSLYFPPKLCEASSITGTLISASSSIKAQFFRLSLRLHYP